MVLVERKKSKRERVEVRKDKNNERRIVTRVGGKREKQRKRKVKS